MSEGKGKRGGKRPGAGRPPGSTNSLPLGAVQAVKAAGLRVPEAATPEQRELADEALGTVVEVMRGQVHYMDAPARLKAATVIRQEICGPVPTKLEHTGADGEPLTVRVVTLDD